ncbi:hypothetical protein [Croceicoccus bisphenolivorans]|uniref:hypothetical protein n=1 Tax=Croceicoccus bisphenolivorans TaxID=1783232 RepID=UPI00082DD227|nr:hypothetical protein [Croceicoccus bisphenolivorans]
MADETPPFEDFLDRVTNAIEREPLKAAAVGGLLLMALAHHAKQTPDPARQHRRQRARCLAQKLKSEMFALNRHKIRIRNAAKALFHNGPFRDECEAVTKIELASNEPFRDGTIERAPFRISSEAFALHLDISCDQLDGFGCLSLYRGNLLVWRLEVKRMQFGFEQINTSNYKPLPAVDLESAKLAARLLAHPQNKLKRITLLRENMAELEKQLIDDWLDSEPIIAEVVRGT